MMLYKNFLAVTCDEKVDAAQAGGNELLKAVEELAGSLAALAKVLRDITNYIMDGDMNDGRTG